MKNILVQIDKMSDQWTTHFTKSGRFNFIPANDEDIFDIFKANIKSLDGIIIFSLSEAMLKICNIVRNERLFDPMMPVAYVGTGRMDKLLPYGSRRFTEVNREMFEHVGTRLRPSILVVEDDEGIREVIELNLEAHFNVSVARDGKEGFEKALGGEFDCILLDVRLPLLTGDQIVSKLKEQSIDTPVVIMTAYDSAEGELDLVLNGVFEYLKKPFTDEGIIRQTVLKAIIEHHRSKGEDALKDAKTNSVEEQREFEKSMSRYI